MRRFLILLEACCCSNGSQLHPGRPPVKFSAMKKSILIKLSFVLFVYAGFSPALLNLKRAGLVNKSPVNSLTQAELFKSSKKLPDHQPQVQSIDFKTSTNVDWRNDVTSVIHYPKHNIETSIDQPQNKYDVTIKKNDMQKKYASSVVTDNANLNLPLESSF